MRGSSWVRARQNVSPLYLAGTKELYRAKGGDSHGDKSMNASYQVLEITLHASPGQDNGLIQELAYSRR